MKFKKNYEITTNAEVCNYVSALCDMHFDMIAREREDTAAHS